MSFGEFTHKSWNSIECSDNYPEEYMATLSENKRIKVNSVDYIHIEDRLCRTSICPPLTARLKTGGIFCGIFPILPQLFSHSVDKSNIILYNES